MSADAEVVLNVSELRERIAALNTKGPEALKAAVVAAVNAAIVYAIGSELSGQRLHRRSGNLQASVAASPIDHPAELGSDSEGPFAQGFIGTSLRYGIAHERGFHGDEFVRAHLRRRLGRPLAYKISTRAVSLRAPLAKRLRDKGPIQVRAFTRRVNIIAKWYLRDAARHVSAGLRQNALDAVTYLARTGETPTLSDLGGTGA